MYNRNDYYLKVQHTITVRFSFFSLSLLVQYTVLSLSVFRLLWLVAAAFCVSFYFFFLSHWANVLNVLYIACFAECSLDSTAHTKNFSLR